MSLHDFEAGQSSLALSNAGKSFAVPAAVISTGEVTLHPTPQARQGVRPCTLSAMAAGGFTSNLSGDQPYEVRIYPTVQLDMVGTSAMDTTVSIDHASAKVGKGYVGVTDNSSNVVVGFNEVVSRKRRQKVIVTLRVTAV